jgi:hypothetical protein
MGKNNEVDLNKVVCELSSSALGSDSGPSFYERGNKYSTFMKDANFYQLIN